MIKNLKSYTNSFMKKDLTKEFYESRLIVKSLYKASLNLHYYIEEKYKLLENEFTLNNVIKGIEVDKTGVIMGWSEISWSVDIMNHINNIVLDIIHIKLKLKEEYNITLKENVLIKFSNSILMDFINNQRIFNVLNEKLKVCCYCHINNLQGIIYDLCKMSQNRAFDSLKILQNYNNNIHELKLHLN